MDVVDPDGRRTDRARPLHADPVGSDVCKKMSGRIINIHHSFLPSRSRARIPTSRPIERGVKLIGATAHYVTADLDEGPIIEQDVARITHAQSGRTTMSRSAVTSKAQVLARAIHAHIHHRTVHQRQPDRGRSRQARDAMHPSGWAET